MEVDMYELQARYDSRASFYGKAKVVTGESGNKSLYSYDTRVAKIEDGTVEVCGDYSQTTNRHIREFLLQNGFKAENTKQIMNDYLIK